MKRILLLFLMFLGCKNVLIFDSDTFRAEIIKKSRVNEKYSFSTSDSKYKGSFYWKEDNLVISYCDSDNFCIEENYKNKILTKKSYFQHNKILKTDSIINNNVTRITEYYDNGNVRELSYYWGLFYSIGPSITYYPEGKIKSKANYYSYGNDSLFGPIEPFSLIYKIDQEGNGIMCGCSDSYFKNGKVKTQTIYDSINPQKFTCIYYYENGKPWIITRYQFIPDSVWIYPYGKKEVFDSLGHLEKIIQW